MYNYFPMRAMLRRLAQGADIRLNIEGTQVITQGCEKCRQAFRYLDRYLVLLLGSS